MIGIVGLVLKLCFIFLLFMLEIPMHGPKISDSGGLSRSHPQAPKSICLSLHGMTRFFLLAFLLLSGDVELNPCPTSFTVCTLNIRSILHPLHSAAISDFIDSHSPDLFCLTETWIKPTATFTEFAHCTPPNYSLLSFPSTSSSKNTSSQALGGGTGFLIRESFTQLLISHTEFFSFESSSVTLKLPHSKISIFNIYRPPLSSTFSEPFSVFLDEFNSFHSFAASALHEFITTGDFNIHLDNHSDHATSLFCHRLT